MNKFIDNSQWPLNSLLVSHKYRVIYTPIGKNANTTLKRMFVRLSGYPRSNEILKGNVHTYLTSNRTGLSLCDYTPEEATAILADDSYFRYVVLREPLARATSGYVEKFVINGMPAGESREPPPVIKAAIDWVYNRRGEEPDYDRSISFEEFVDHLVECDDRSLDTHFKSQESYLVQQRFDFMGVVENMRPLIEVLEPRFNQKIEMEFKNRTAHKKSLFRRRGQGKLLPTKLRAQRALPRSHELLTDEITGQLQHRYARDVQLWQEARK
jgi:hypothetical protein